MAAELQPGRNREENRPQIEKRGSNKHEFLLHLQREQKKFPSVIKMSGEEKPKKFHPSEEAAPKAEKSDGTGSNGTDTPPPIDPPGGKMAEPSENDPNDIFKQFVELKSLLAEVYEGINVQSARNKGLREDLERASQQLNNMTEREKESVEVVLFSTSLGFIEADIEQSNKAQEKMGTVLNGLDNAIGNIKKVWGINQDDEDL